MSSSSEEARRQHRQLFQPVKEPVMQCHIKDDDDDNDDDDDDDLGRLPRKQCNVKKWCRKQTVH